MWRVQNAVVLRCGIAIDALKQRALPLERFFVCVEIRVFRGREWLEGRGDCFRLIADAGLVFTNVCFQTGAAIRGEICNAIVSLHDNPTDAPSVSGLAD